MAAKTGRKGSAPRNLERPDDNVAPVTTVVGGQSRRHAHGTTRVPIGIEKVLYLAATSQPFRTRLFSDRAAAVAAARVRLTDVERATLLGVPQPALEAMIARLSPARHGGRRLMKTVAAATVSLAAGIAGPGCADDDDGTADAEADVDVPPGGDGGIWPDADVDPDWAPDVGDDDSGGDTADVDVPPGGDGGIWPDADVDPDWAPDVGDDDSGGAE